MSRSGAFRALAILVAFTAGSWARELPAQAAEKQGPAEEREMEGLTVQELERTMRWLTQRSRPVDIPSRDIFAPVPTHLEPRASSPSPPGPASPESQGNEPEPEPRLAGFLRRTDLRGGERTFALLRLDNESWLVEQGDEIGSYRVEEMVDGQEVLLEELATGRRLRLSLDE